jgi:hypothetical protein
MSTAQHAPTPAEPVSRAPAESRIAIVGDGFGSLLVYAAAIYLGFEPEQLTVVGTSETPVVTYGRLAGNLGQTVLRSESESHFLPADWPTFAQLDAWSRRSLAPLARSIRRRYNPGLADILTEASVVGRRLGWDRARVPQRVGWLRRGWEPTPHFTLHGEDGECLARARHVMLALGRGPLAFPPLLARARTDPELAGRIVHAYEHKSYQRDRRYVVVGAGIAAANECANALTAGANVIALRRRATTEVQDLNVPRCLFEARGIDTFQKLPFEQRVAFLEGILRGTSPARRTWRARIAAGRRDGCYHELIGEIDTVERLNGGLRVHVSGAQGPDTGWLEVHRVVTGTGFTRSVLTLPLVRRLVHEYDLPVEQGRLKLLSNCGVSKLDRDDSRLCTMGLIANTVIPNGDTIAGLKYVGRRFVADCARAEGLRVRPLTDRVRMQLSLAAETAGALRDLRPTEQEG